jgi:hypothetical protein
MNIAFPWYFFIIAWQMRYIQNQNQIISPTMQSMHFIVCVIQVR